MQQILYMINSFLATSHGVFTAHYAWFITATFLL